jgi:alpha-2-macroglobulin
MPANRRRSFLILTFHMLVIVSLACSLPSLSRQTDPEPGPAASVDLLSHTPIGTPTTLPPALVETSPPPGSEVPLGGPITLHFNQPMDHRSVEASVSGQPALSGRFHWESDSALSFIPDSPFLPGSDIAITVGSNALSRSGLAILNPITLNYRAAGYLQLTQMLPEPDAVEVSPTSAVVAAFNRPLVALGQTQTEPAFTLEPPVNGRGEWINTSTYIFYPEPSLRGDETYQAVINSSLISVDGSPLDPSTRMEGWAFSTSQPVLLSIDASDEYDTGNFSVRPDADIVMEFNQPMDITSVRENFAMSTADGRLVEGEFTTNENLDVITFSPEGLLDRNASYSVTVGAQTSDAGGTPIKTGATTRIYTVPGLRVDYTNPPSGGEISPYSSIILHFTAHLPDEDLLEYISFSPQVPDLSIFMSPEKRGIYVSGRFAPETNYTLSLSPDFPDAWGSRLGYQFVLSFATLPLEPRLSISSGMDALFMRPEETGIPIQATNLDRIFFSLGRVSLEDFLTMMSPEGYEIRQNYLPREAQQMQQSISTARNISESLKLELSPDGEKLAPGVYYLRLDDQARYFHGISPFIVVSNIQLTLKNNGEEMFVWAVDLRDFKPVTNQPVKVYDEFGRLSASGSTDPEGIFRTPLDTRDPYAGYSVIVGSPGEDSFGAALSAWSQGLYDWTSGIPISYDAPELQTYIYTDRSIYQPGQTVYFKAAARYTDNGRYHLPEFTALPLTLYTDLGEEVEVFNLPLSAFGTAHGEYEIPIDAQPGTYRILYGNEYRDALQFTVAHYRKPEIDLNITFESDHFLYGEAVSAMVQAGYYFGVPASNINIRWALYAAPSYENILPGYQVGPLDRGWFFWHFPLGMWGLGEIVAEGSGMTRPDGSLMIEPADLEISEYLQNKKITLTLEATASDEGDQPVSSRAQAALHPGIFYAGVKPDSWTGRAGTEKGYDVLLVDLDGSPAANIELFAEFNKVTWRRQNSSMGDYDMPVQPVYTPVSSARFVTGEDGMARLAFTPPDAGTYQLEIRGSDDSPGKTVTQALVWIEGPGEPHWPTLANQRVEIVLDREEYLPGDSANLFVPNPLEGEALALITIERASIERFTISSISPGGETISIPIEIEDFPNVYISVIMLGQNSEGIPEFRHGIANLFVQPGRLSLNVNIETVSEGPLSPGDEVSFRLKVTDHSGQPVRAEFSLSLVDKAVLALAEPNSVDIETAFYGQQPLGIHTALSLAAHIFRSLAGNGIGGGGGDEMQLIELREKFEDTAYWNAAVLTDENGEAIISLRLPDNLTTWVLDVRGITQDNRVGQANVEISTSKELMIRPVTPRFLVAGDHLALSAVVHNNTDEELTVETTIQASGFSLDDQADQSQLVTINAGERIRIDWWGVVQPVDQVEIIFSASSGEYRDASRPTTATALGHLERGNSSGLPVLNYSSRQTFATAGLLEERGEKLELVSLPEFAGGGQAQTGSLKLELASSLGAAAITSLEAMENTRYETNESIVSRLLPNLETYRALQMIGVDNPELKNRLERTLQESLRRLLANQNRDGGWSWWFSPGLMSGGDPDITAYILFSLSRADQLGLIFDESVIRRTVNFIEAGLPSVEMLVEDWQFDRLAFQHFALAEAGAGKPEGLLDLYENRSRLSPSSQALLAYSMDKVPGENEDFGEKSKTILSDLKATAYRSAAGVHWETGAKGLMGRNTPVSTSGMVVHVLAQKDPASAILPDAVRYLMAARNPRGGWASTYETAWALMGIMEYMKGAGDFGGDFSFSASLNGVQIASGQARDGSALTNPVSTELSTGSLFSEQPNALVIQRGAGPGRLYYLAHLDVSIPVGTIRGLNQGLTVSREYYSAADFHAENAHPTPVTSGPVGEVLIGKVTLILPNDAYYVIVEDHIPAGSELIDMGLKSSTRGEGSAAYYDPRNPLSDGWGWWYFHPPDIYAERIVWATDYLPAGTYQLVYAVHLLQPGDFQVLPARAWQMYFPDVQGNSQGTKFEIRPDDG